jgi:hypothetical protein
MVSFFSFVSLALAGMVAASPVKRAPSLAVSLSTGAASVNSIDEISLVTTVENTVSSCHRMSRAIINMSIPRLKERPRHQSAKVRDG